MLRNKKILIFLIGMILFSLPILLAEEQIITYECYFERIGKIAGIKDSGKDLIICNYPSINGTYQGMYHSYYHENDLYQQIVIEQGQSYTYSGKTK